MTHSVIPRSCVHATGMRKYFAITHAPRQTRRETSPFHSQQRQFSFCFFKNLSLQHTLVSLALKLQIKAVQLKSYGFFFFFFFPTCRAARCGQINNPVEKRTTLLWHPLNSDVSKGEGACGVEIRSRLRLWFNQRTRSNALKRLLQEQGQVKPSSC